MISEFQDLSDKIERLAALVGSLRRENALLTQKFVMDGETPVQDVVAKAGKDAGSPIVLKDYVRFQLGEGIEKEESDFAAEVAAAAGLS